MSRRIEIQLTSRKSDETWTWRAAGAREPKGVVASSLVPEGVKEGDVLRAEVDTTIDGIEVLSMTATTAVAQKPAKVEVIEVAPVAVEARTHTVASGDTLFNIAQQYLGDGNRYPELAAANGIANPDHIEVGQVITIP